MARNPIPKATDDEIAAFATFLRKKDSQEKADRQMRDDASRAERERVAGEQAAARTLEAARERKENAVRDMKRLQAGRFTFDERAQAEQEYRASLANLIAIESGKRPEWAPPEPVETPDKVVDTTTEPCETPEAESEAEVDSTPGQPTAE